MHPEYPVVGAFREFVRPLLRDWLILATRLIRLIATLDQGLGLG